MATTLPAKSTPISVALYPKEKEAWLKLASKRRIRPCPMIREVIVKELESAGFDPAKLIG
jgi:hypothetical protein